MLQGSKPSTKHGISTRTQGDKMETRREATAITTLRDTVGYTRFVWSRELKRMQLGAVCMHCGDKDTL